MKDPRIEQFLKANGIAYHYAPQVLVSNIRPTAACRQQIRLDAKLDQEVVARYVEATEQGTEFPALVLHEQGGVLVPDNGLHRLAAYEQTSTKTTDAYICEMTEPQDADAIERVRRTINLVEGVAPSPTEALKHAVELVAKGMSAADAAKLVLMRPSRVQRAVFYEKTKDRLIELAGLRSSDFDRLGRQAVEDLGKVNNPEILAAMTKLAIEARFVPAQIKEFSRQVRSKATDAQMTAVVEKWRTENAARIKETSAGRISPPISRLTKSKLFAARVASEMGAQLTKGLSRLERAEALRFLKKFRAEIDTMIRRLEGNHQAPARPSRVTARAN